MPAKPHQLGEGRACPAIEGRAPERVAERAGKVPRV